MTEAAAAANWVLQIYEERLGGNLPYCSRLPIDPSVWKRFPHNWIRNYTNLGANFASEINIFRTLFTFHPKRNHNKSELRTDTDRRIRRRRRRRLGWHQGWTLRVTLRYAQFHANITGCVRICFYSWMSDCFANHTKPIDFCSARVPILELFWRNF